MNCPYFIELLRRKRDGNRLNPQEIARLIKAYTNGEIPDYQMSAWLMAAYLRGLSRSETVALTKAMLESGTILDLSHLPGPKIDKHSTGGVGDKVSLILAPLIAACGVIVPMVSGRSLGHTGGTLDKLAAIPGFKTNLKIAEFYQVLAKVGVGIIGQTEEMCPADRKLYALRDVTATVESIPLIAASIMSKKLAEGIDGLVLDVKTGNGAFMRQRRDARQLARLMLSIGSAFGKKGVALVTDMSQPLGRAVGNALEVKEAIEALKGNWQPDLQEVTLALGEEMLFLAGKAEKRPQARRLLLRALTTGGALKKFQEMVAAQGGDPTIVEDYTLLPSATYKKEVFAKEKGYIRSIDTLQVGLLGLEIGLGRKTLDDEIDPGAGFIFWKKINERVTKDEVLAEVFAAKEALADKVTAGLAKCFTYSLTPVPTTKLIIDRLGALPPSRRKKKAQR